MGAERITEFLRLAQVAGHAPQVGCKVFKAGAAFDQLLRGGQGVVGIALDCVAPGIQFLPTVGLGHQALQVLLHAGNVGQHLACFVEGFQFTSGYGAIEQAG